MSLSHASNLLAAFAITLAPALAIAGPKEEAGKHIEKATKAHSEEKYDVALVELEAAYKLDPDPELLYAIGQVHSKLGHCNEAASFYEKYQQTNKDPQVKAVIEQAIAACKPTEPPPPPPPDPKLTDPPPGGGTTGGVGPTDPNPGGGAEGAPWYRGKLPFFVAGGGVVVGLIGVLVYTDARSDLDAAEKAPTLDEYNSLVDDAKSKRNMSAVLIGGGVALVGTGVVLYMLRDKGHESRGVSVTPARDGGMITWSGSF